MDEDDDTLLPIDDLVRWSKGELPRHWLDRRVAMLRRRAERLVAEMEAIRLSHPELYERLSKPF